MGERKCNIPEEYRGANNQRKFPTSELLKRKVVFEIDTATSEAGLKDSDVAKRLGISRQTYSRMKSPKTPLNMGNMEAIADALGCEIQIKLIKRGDA